MTRNQVMLYKLLVNFSDDLQDNLAMAMTVQHNLMNYGYMLDQAGFDQLKKTDAANIQDFYNECEEILKEMLGGKESYTSLYGNFPNDILSMTQSELWYNQVMHYWGKKKFEPKGLPKDSAFEHVTYKIIKGVDSNAILDVYRLLAGSGQVLTKMDSKVLRYFATSGIELPLVDVPLKENLALLASLLPGFKVKTVIDVLRIAVGYSGGDVGLPAVPKSLKKKGPKWAEREKEREKFKFKLNPTQKESVMRLFESSNLSLSDMKQGSKYGRFVRLSEVIAVQLHKDTFPLTFAAFHKLKNQKRKGKPDGVPVIRTWQSQVDSQFKLSFLDGLNKLSERPGELFRRLDYLVRTAKNKGQVELVLQAMYTCGIKVSNKVLFEAYTHFEGRGIASTNRTIFIPGARVPTKLPNLPALNSSLIDDIQNRILNAIKEKFSTLSKLGKIYLDPELKKIPLPTNMKSLSESLTPVIRGTRTPMEPTGKVLRSFIHWFDVHGNEDLDLHGFLLSDTQVSSFGYNGVHSSNLGCYSGDVMNRQGACAEYVDLYIDKTIQAGFKYYIPMVHNYKMRGFETMKDTVSGFMYRETSTANRAWVPSTIENAIKLSSKSTRTLLGVFDLTTKEYIHLDLDFENFNNVLLRGDMKGFKDLMQKYISVPKVSVYDLLEWNVEKRGTLSSKEEAETHFMFADFKSDYTAILPWMGV